MESSTFYAISLPAHLTGLFQAPRGEEAMMVDVE